MAKSKKSHSLINPFFLTLAAGAGWAAAHEPAHLTLASGGVWVCSALTVGLLSRAALALLIPLLEILGVLFGRAVKGLQSSGSEP